MRDGPYRNVIREYEPGVWGIGTVPTFAIGQRGMIIRTSAGNILWDCITYLDDDTVDKVRKIGGIQVMAVSHPHFYTTMAEWAEAFGNVPILLNASDSEWVMRREPTIHFWTGRHELAPGVTLIQCGGHFPGSSVLHWAAGAGGRGVLFTGDTLQVGADRQSLSVMYSYPNYIPSPPEVVRQVAEALANVSFDRVYGMTWDRVISSNARACLDNMAWRQAHALKP
jgi:glyoxylase-like metal-dependent hydrolase (beta-lactamase superfamily II)